MSLKGVSVPAMLIGGGGLLFLWSGLHGASVTAGLRDLIGGHQPSGTNLNPIAGTSFAAAAPGDSGSSANIPAGFHGGNRALGRLLAAARGWTGSQWTALDQLFTRESGWSNTAKNPSSGAYGIAQALGHGPTNQYPGGNFRNANPPPYGTSDARLQIEWGLNYIAQRYGNPVSAWAHETSAGWY